MCMEDIRLGRSLGGYSTVKPCPDATSTNIVGNNLKRTRIHVSVSNGETAVIAPQGIAVESGRGLLINAGRPSVSLTVEEWGDLLFGPWFASGVGAAANLFIAELTLERE